MSALRQFAKYASLNTLAMIGISFYVLADTFFISLAEGHNGLTALNLVLPIYSLLFALGAMIGTGSATRFVILRARGEQAAERLFMNAAEFALMIGLVFMAIGGLFPQSVVRLMGGDAEIVAVGTAYTRTFMLFSPCFILNHVFNAFVRNDGDPAVAMAATLSSSLSNIALDYLFMFPLGMGMMGAALATGISPVISIAVCSLHFFSKKNTLRFSPTLPSLRMLWEACRLGVSAFVGEISSGVTTMTFNFVILGLSGNTGVAAYGVIANYALVANSVFNGIAQGAQPLVSRAYGERDFPTAKRLLKLAAGTALVIAAAMLAAVFAFSPSLVAVFNSEGSSELAALAEVGMRLYFVGFLFAAINIIGTGFLSATERAGAAFAAAILRGFAAIVGFAFALGSLFGMTGVWLAFPAAELVTAAVTVAALARWGRSRS